nr:hypothetical protein [Azospirillum brasilense]
MPTTAKAMATALPAPIRSRRISAAPRAVIAGMVLVMIPAATALVSRSP